MKNMEIQFINDLKHVCFLLGYLSGLRENLYICGDVPVHCLHIWSHTIHPTAL